MEDEWGTIQTCLIALRAVYAGELVRAVARMGVVISEADAHAIIAKVACQCTLATATRHRLSLLAQKSPYALLHSRWTPARDARTTGASSTGAQRRAHLLYTGFLFYSGFRRASARRRREAIRCA